MRRPRRPEDYRDFKIVRDYSEKEKDFKPSRGIDLALFFPASYRVAASSLSFTWVRDLLYSENVGVERFFFHKSFSRFYSLENLRPVDEFRNIAFSYNFEMDLFNILEILKKIRIPIRWKDRNLNHPLIIVGGAMTYFNPSIAYPIADVVYLGDLEEDVKRFSGALLKESKEASLEIFNLSPFVSIPRIGKFGTVAKVGNLNRFPPIGSVLTPEGEFKNKLLIEIGRGCIRRCSFCMIGHLQKPARFLKIDTLKKILSEIPKNISLGIISATVTDYPWLDELLDILEDRRFSVSSMRMDKLNLRLLKMLRNSGQKSFTVAPEGGTQKIRDILKKDIEDQHIERALLLGRKSGFDNLKMYFIYGVPNETEEDLKGISEIASLALKMGYKTVKLSLNPLIPKPGTPMEKTKMESIKILKKKRDFLQRSLKVKGVKFHFEGLRESLVQYGIANSKSDDVEEYLDIFEKFGSRELERFIYKKFEGK